MFPLHPIKAIFSDFEATLQKKCELDQQYNNIASSANKNIL